jgi:Uma2 family endonuclease
MATATHIPLEVYLRSSYEPDAEYVDGDIEERNVGEYDHSAVQKAVLIWFYLHEKEWHIRGIQEQRTRVAPSRVRLPDVSVFSRDLPIEQVFTRPQLIAVEVLSPEDRHSISPSGVSPYKLVSNFGGEPEIRLVQPFEGDTEINQAAVRCFLQDRDRSCDVEVTT